MILKLSRLSLTKIYKQINERADDTANLKTVSKTKSLLKSERQMRAESDLVSLAERLVDWTIKAQMARAEQWMDGEMGIHRILHGTIDRHLNSTDFI